MNLKELRAAYKTAYDAMQDARTACEENTDETRTDALHGELQAAIETATQARDAMERGDERAEAILGALADWAEHLGADLG